MEEIERSRVIPFRVLFVALRMTVVDRLSDILTVVSGASSTSIKRKIQTPTSCWVTAPLWSRVTPDGAILEGVNLRAGAKYTIPKGLPEQDAKALAIENDPHLVDGFSGEIASGYGKGTKTLLEDQIVAVKVHGKTFFSRMNYHLHDADVAGIHYDLSIEQLDPGTKEWELHIPKGIYAGRYAFRTTDKGIVVIPMKDRGVILPKPNYILKDEDWLSRVVAPNISDYVIERKPDGSLANAAFHNGRATFRSHRESGHTYYDQIPSLEFSTSKSRFYCLRTIDHTANLDGTIVKVELVHPDGVSRVSGILNSLPDRAVQTQIKRGPLQAYAWDIVKYKGKDLSSVSYGERRKVLESFINEIRLYNSNWHIVDRYYGKDPLAFYRKIINDPRGLPYSEGIVIKPINSIGEIWYKIKNRDFVDLTVIEFLEGSGKYAGSLGKLLVEDPISHGRGEVGSFAISDAHRNWIWDHRNDLVGAVAKISVNEMTKSGSPRAGVFHQWHPDPRYGGIGTEMALHMYADSVAGMDPVEANSTLYAIKSAAGWRKK